MGGNRTDINVKGRGAEMTVSHTATDAPILPVAQLEKLKEIAPERIGWVFDETSREAEARRSENRRVNTLIFVERMFGQVCGFLIGIAGLSAAVYCGVHDAQWTGSVIGGATLVGLVSAFVLRGAAKQQTSSDKKK